MHYGSGLYLFSILFLLLCLTGAWVILRRCCVNVQRFAVLLLMVLNVFQHVMKPILYPHYRGQGFSHVVTAYNMCAFLILLSPAVYLWGNRLFRNFLYVMGTVAGIGAIVFPIWFIGMDPTELGWEYVRFYTCHVLLFLSSLLPLLLGHHKPSYKEFWQVGLGFLLALCAILVNNMILISAGFYKGAVGGDMYTILLQHNPCMMMRPWGSASWILAFVRIFSPSVFLGNNPSGNFVPILWYAVPLYLTISFFCLVLFCAMDRKNLSADMKRLSKNNRERL